MKINIKIFVTMISIITIAMPFLAGCSTSITREEVEKELISFMINGIVQKPDGEFANYAQTSGQPWLNPPSSAVLIVYSPATKQKTKILGNK